jgi:glycogenin glucosyltransferase
MWYKLPETKPKPADPPKPIFPWERESTRPKATRVFAEDYPPEPIRAAAPEVSEFEASPTHAFSTVHYEPHQGAPRTKATRVWRDEPHVSTPKTAEESWQAFSQTNANAWDSVPGIDSYVRSIMDSQVKRGKVQVLQQATGTEEIGSPTLLGKDRRESLILTDFPSAVERPSLPVTPAPVRRPTFWGEERDETGELPAAEGVPEQSDWVCPQCGFSSSYASDFGPRRSSFASASKNDETPSSTLASVIDAPGSSLRKKKEFPGLKDEPMQREEQEAVVEAPEEVEEGAQVQTTPVPNPRSGLSTTGVPLASLTDPSLFSAGSCILSYPASSSSAPSTGQDTAPVLELHATGS